MSRSLKKVASGNRHASDKYTKQKASRKVRRKNNICLNSFESSNDEDLIALRDSKELCSVAWSGEKESCHGVYTEKESRKYILKEIEYAKREISMGRWEKIRKYVLNVDAEDYWDGHYLHSWRQLPKRPWDTIKKNIFYNWNNKLLVVLKIKVPSDLWKITDKDIEKAVKLTHKFEYLMK